MNEIELSTERIDDIPLLIEQQRQMGLAEIIDSTIDRHGNRRGLSMGWMIVSWISYILSQSDHRLSYVEAWAEKLLTTLNQSLYGEVRSQDFTDDRLGDALCHLSDDAVWETIERKLNQHCLQVYDLETNVARLDTTTVSMHHDANNSDWVAFGHSKDHRPDLAQLKLMLVTVDPLAMPLVTQVVPGNMADDGLYIPAIVATQASLTKRGLLYVGDSKMEALSTRAHCATTGDYYLHPLSLKGQQNDLLAQWVDHVLDNDMVTLTDVYHHESDDLLAQGWETSRLLNANVETQPVNWDERLLLIYSPALAAAGYRGIEKRLVAATTALEALTPPVGRGRSQWTELPALEAAVTQVLARYRLQGCLEVSYEKEVSQREVRRYKERPARTETMVRYQIKITPNAQALTAARRLIGWRLFVTNAPSERLSLSDAVRIYRGSAPTIERLFARLKGRPLGLRPVFVRRDDALVGLCRLMTLALRVLTLIEFVVRRSLEQTGETLVGLVPGNPKMATARPTTERILHAFSQVTLSVIEFETQQIRHITPLTPLQQHILRLLKFSKSLYTDIALQKPILV